MKMHIVIGCCYFHKTNKQKQPNLHFGSSLSPAGQSQDPGRQCRVSPCVLMDLVNCRNPLIQTNCRFRGKHATTLTNMPRDHFSSRSGPIEEFKRFCRTAEAHLDQRFEAGFGVAPCCGGHVSRPSHITTCNESELLTACVGKPRNCTPVFLLLLSPMQSFDGFRRAEWAFQTGQNWENIFGLEFDFYAPLEEGNSFMGFLKIFFSSLGKAEDEIYPVLVILFYAGF